ncbi:hypothetical protein GCM10011581_21930 [Saccharopolyspora subtropica]|uniref:Uncharacterized protein n=1 Tax=Saccharopolyspora thermophila TaxID=89367 RepID=A0A917JVI7_9PSEU|nr:hypothetical protein [Saccharopolyspora subtropica]GGI84411.1 hypothetical protein GCM10011581_21930 [Saccharopolyspora subtropica]
MTVKSGRPVGRGGSAPDQSGSEAGSSLTGVLAATVLDEIYRRLDETYASLGITRWNQPPAVALWHARCLDRQPPEPRR